MIELKPCPFCKCTEIVAGKDYADGSYRVDCLGCFAYVKANSLDLAIKAWQSRPVEDALNAKIECLTAERDATSEDNRMLSERVQRLVDANKSLTALVERLKEDAEKGKTNE